MRLSIISIADRLFGERTLQYIHADMLAQQRNPTARGLYLLIIGVAGILCTSGCYFYLRQEISVTEQPAAPASARSHVSKTDSEEAVLIDQATAQLNIPWDRLFLAIETVNSEKVHILSLTPEPARQTFTLTADAGDVKEMLAYVSALSVQPALSVVHLTSQQAMTDGKKEVLEFTLEGSWATP